MREIEDSLKTFRDLKNSLDTAEEKGRAEGIEIGREEGIGIGVLYDVAMLHTFTLR